MKRKRRVRILTFRRDLQMAMTALSEKTGHDGFEPGVFQIEHVCVTIPDLNPAFDGYRIASIADIHLGQWLNPKRLDGVIGMINKQHPDLIAIIGDLFSYEVDRYSTETIASFTKLNPNDVSVAVLGNHDHWVGEAAVREILQQSNIIDLSNDVYTLRRGGQRYTSPASTAFPSTNIASMSCSVNFRPQVLQSCWPMNLTLLT